MNNFLENEICLSLCVTKAEYAVGLLIDLLSEINDRLNPFLNLHRISYGMYGTFCGFTPKWDNALISVDMRCANARASYELIVRLISYIQDIYRPDDPICHVYYLK